jgi:hypothetical protein
MCQHVSDLGVAVSATVSNVLTAFWAGVMAVTGKREKTGTKETYTTYRS